MCTIKGRNCRYLTEAEDIKEKWQEYTGELYKKGLHDPDNHDGVITHLEPDILECEVKWVLESITMNKIVEVMGFQWSSFKSWNRRLWKCFTQYANKFGKLSSGHGTGKCVFIPIPTKGNAKECSDYCTIALISHASKVMLKILQARLQQYVNRELSNVQAGFRKGRGTRDHIANICWIMEKARDLQEKHLFLLYWLCKSLWLCGSQ